MDTLGQRIAFYRKTQNMTQAELAEACSVSAQAVSKWENDIAAPDISLLPILADLFHVTIDELFGAERKTVPPSEEIDPSKTLLRMEIRSADGDVVKFNFPLSLALSGEKRSMKMFGGKGAGTTSILSRSSRSSKPALSENSWRSNPRTATSSRSGRNNGADPFGTFRSSLVRRRGNVSGRRGAAVCRAAFPYGKPALLRKNNILCLN